MNDRPRFMRTLSVCLLLAAHGASSGAKCVAGQEPASVRVRVFVECNGDACDTEHLRSQIAYVDWVRDRFDADVEILVTEGATGAGGQRYEVAFEGRGRFEGVEETLQYTWNPTDTDGEARDDLTRTLGAGLIRYVARTPALEQIDIRYDPDAGVSASGSPDDDPWNRWVFRTGFSGSFAAEDRSDDASVSLSQSAGRVTEEVKLALDLSGDYSESNFDTSDTTSVTSVKRSFVGELLYVHSAGDHWGVGGRVSAEHSTFSNFDLSLRVAPAVEYNIFPYDESTRRQLRILYAVGPRLLDYAEETIFFETSETRLHQALNVSLDVEEPWGSAIVALEASHFIDELARNRLEGFGFLQVRLIRGLGLFVEASFARVRDQINIPRGEATEAEVLLRQRELLTDFRLEGRIGVDLTFGSIFSDVVNARFGS